MGQPIYLIKGWTGEWEGYGWDVKAYRTKYLAERFLSECQAWADQYAIIWHHWNETIFLFEREVGSARFDNPELEKQWLYLLSLEPEIDEFKWSDEHMRCDDGYIKYFMTEIYLDQCPSDGMFTPQSHLCQDCNGGC